MKILMSALTKGVCTISGTLRWGWFLIRLGANAPRRSVALAQGVRLVATDGGTLRIGAGTAIERHAVLVAKRGSIDIGANSFIGIGCVLVARDSIRIGPDALLGEYVTIRDQDHRPVSDPGNPDRGFDTAPISIGRNVWLGAKVTVTRGVTIGDNVVVGANSVVTRDLPAGCLAAGVPARVIRQSAARKTSAD